MTSESQEPLEKVLKHYPINVTGIRNESYKEKKGVWWVGTPDGNRILKKISNSEDTFKHILHCVKHLCDNGCHIPRAILTNEDKEYVVLDGTCYVLLEAIEGKNPSYSSPKELSQIVKALADFHKASNGFSPAADTKPKYHLGTWLEDYEHQLEDMNNFYKNELSTKTPDNIGKSVIREFPAFYERGRRAIEGLHGKEFSEWVKKAGREGCLCHQDFAAGNLLLHSSGKIYILDTDSITVDIPARDIRKLLNKIMKKSGKWDISLTQKIFSYYQEVNPLTPSEWQVVKLDLLFPHLFLGAMSKYYYKRDKEWSNEKYLQRINEMAQFEKTVSYVIDNFDSIIPK